MPSTGRSAREKILNERPPSRVTYLRGTSQETVRAIKQIEGVLREDPWYRVFAAPPNPVGRGIR